MTPEALEPSASPAEDPATPMRPSDGSSARSRQASGTADSVSTAEPRRAERAGRLSQLRPRVGLSRARRRSRLRLREAPIEWPTAGRPPMGSLHRHPDPGSHGRHRHPLDWGCPAHRSPAAPHGPRPGARRQPEAERAAPTSRRAPPHSERATVGNRVGMPHAAEYDGREDHPSTPPSGVSIASSRPIPRFGESWADRGRIPIPAMPP